MISNETIWITGATSGIGKALVEQFKGNGNRIIISGRNQEALDALSSLDSGIVSLQFDVTDRDKVPEVQQQLSQLTPYLDRVILNAGDCQYLDPSDFDWQMVHNIMQINFFGAVNCIDASLALLKKADKGHIVGVSSQAILAPFPHAEAYGASKAALSYFLKSLRMDVHQFGIDVSVLMPGFVDTPLTQKNDFPMPFLMPVETAATRMIKAIEARPFTYIFPKRLSWLMKIADVFPRFWLTKNADSSAL